MMKLCNTIVNSYAYILKEWGVCPKLCVTGVA